MRRKRKKETTLSEPMSLELSEWDVQRQYNFYLTEFPMKDAKQFMMNYATTEAQRHNINSQSYLPFSQCWCTIDFKCKYSPENLVQQLNSFIENLKKEKKSKKVESLFIVFQLRFVAKTERDAYNYVETQIDSLIDSKGKKEISAESAITIFELTKPQANQIAEWMKKNISKIFVNSFR